MDDFKMKKPRQGIVIREDVLTQTAPWPEALAELVEEVEFKPRWFFTLRNIVRDKKEPHGVEGSGLTLIITVSGQNSYSPYADINVAHYFIVPAATYDKRAWMRWLFDQCILVETHEAMEFFKIGGSRPYAPNHGPGRNPYIVHERGTEEDASTSSSGSKGTFIP